MRISRAVGFIVVLCQGLIAGILVGYLASRPARAVMDTPDFVRYQQLVHVYYQPMMQVLIITATLAGVVWLVLLRRAVRSSDFVFAALAFAAILLIFGLTRSINVPLNNLLMTWDPAAPPANAHDLWAPWETSHFVRTIASVVGFICALAALMRTRKTSQTP